MGRINIQTLVAFTKKHMSWLMIVALICDTVSAFATSVIESDLWWGFGIIGCVGIVCDALITISLLFIVLKTTSQKLLPLGFFIGTMVTFALSSLIVDTTELYEFKIEDYNLIGNLIIALLFISGLSYFIMMIIMFRRLKRSFSDTLALIGKRGMTIVWMTVILYYSDIKLEMGNYNEVRIVITCIAYIIYAILYFKYLRTVASYFVLMNTPSNHPEGNNQIVNQ